MFEIFLVQTYEEFSEKEVAKKQAAKNKKDEATEKDVA